VKSAAISNIWDIGDIDQSSVSGWWHEKSNGIYLRGKLEIVPLTILSRVVAVKGNKKNGKA
jgi:hypothetical protein